MDDHQILIRGTRRRGKPPLVCEVGAEVPHEAADLVQRMFLLPYRSAWALEPASKPGLGEELFQRGYDLPTFRLSLHLLGHGVPRKPRLLRIRPGVLMMRWGWLEHDRVGDVSSAWALPCRRADSSLLMSRLSQPVVTKEGSRPMHTSGIQQLQAAGWDLRTLSLEVRHLGWLYRPEFAGHSPRD